MKNRIKNLIKRILYSSMYDILEVKIVEKFENIIIFYENGKIIETKPMMVNPEIGSIVYLKHFSIKFKVESKIYVSQLGHEIHIHGKKIK